MINMGTGFSLHSFICRLIQDHLCFPIVYHLYMFARSHFYCAFVLVMDRITATACYFDNRNRDAVVKMTTATVTAVIFSTTANILRHFYAIS